MPPSASIKRLSRWLSAAIVALPLISAQSHAALDGSTITPVGLHPGGIAGYNGNPYFCNFLKIDDRNWLMYGGDWDGIPQEFNPSLINSDGYPIAMPSGTYVNKAGDTVSVPSGGYLFTHPGQGGIAEAAEAVVGRYVLEWTGAADIRAGTNEMEYVSGDPETGVITNGRRIYKTRTINPWNGTPLAPNGTRVEIRGLGSAPITNIRLSMPDPTDPWNKSLETGTYHPTFLDRIADKDWSFIRFMDMGYTNANPQRDWADRRKPTHCFQNGLLNTRVPAPEDYVIYDDGQGTVYYPTGKKNSGMSFELMVELCNTSDTDLWITTPHLATDDFLNNLAKLITYGSDGVNPYNSPQSNPVHAPLNANLKVYLEFSNEVWQWPNDTFPQTIWAKVQADAAGISVAVFNARQFSRLWSIFENYLPADRVHRVAACWASDGAPSSYTGTLIAEFYNNSTLLKPEIISPATYFGNDIQQWVKDNKPNLPGAPTDAYWTSTQFETDLNEMYDVWTRLMLSGSGYGGISQRDTVSLPGGFDETIHDLAVERNLEIVCYEGGPSIYTDHMNGVGTEDDGITIFMNESNRRTRFGTLYRIHMNQGIERGIRSHSMFTMSGAWSKYGQWGHLEYLFQKPEDAIKYAFTTEWFENAKTLNHVDHPSGAVPAFTTETLPVIEASKYVSTTISAAGGNGTLLVEEIASILPAGLSFNLSTLTLSGTPTETGKGYIYLMVEDADGDPAWETFQVVVVPEGAFGPTATIDFEDSSVGTIASGIYDHSSGYRLADTGNGGPLNLEIYGTAEGYDSKVVQNYAWSRSITLSNPGGYFHLKSFDYATGRWDGNNTVEVTAYFINGSTATLSLSTDSKSATTQTVNWNELEKVTFVYPSEFGVLDNFALSGTLIGDTTPPTTPPPSTGDSVTIDFETATAGTINSGVYVASGMSFEETGYGNSLNLIVIPPSEYPNYASTILGNESWNRTLRVRKADGSAFELTSFDYAIGQWADTSTATVTAYFKDGTTATRTINTSTKVMATEALSGWINLDRVEIACTNKNMAFDNFVIGGGGGTTTPPPSSSEALTDFELVTPGVISSGVYADPSGMSFEETGYGSALNLIVIGPTEYPNYASTVMGNETWSRTLRIRKTDASAFELLSFDYAIGQWADTSTATVTAYFMDGTTATRAITTNTKVMTTEAFSGWQNLEKVEVACTVKNMAFDNFITK